LDFKGLDNLHDGKPSTHWWTVIFARRCMRIAILLAKRRWKLKILLMSQRHTCLLVGQSVPINTVCQPWRKRQRFPAKLPDFNTVRYPAKSVLDFT